MELNNIIFSVLLILFVFFLSKSFLYVFNKAEIQILKDDQFNKPQAFHQFPVSTTGGIGIFISFLILFSYFSLSQKIIYYDPFWGLYGVLVREAMC